MEPQEELTGELINDTDGGDQITNVNIVFMIPMFCWFNPFMFPFGFQQPKQ